MIQKKQELLIFKLFHQISQFPFIFYFSILYYYYFMLISPEEYLSLTDQIALLSLKCITFQSENKKLYQENLQQRQSIKFLQSRLDQEIQKQHQAQKQLIKHINNNSQNVKLHINTEVQGQMKHFEDQINKIKSDSNVQRIKQIQKKLTENRFINHQMVDFYQKIDSLYKVLNKVSKSPSMPELYKWVSIRKAEELISMFLPNNGGSQITLNTSTYKPNLNMSKIYASKTSISRDKNDINQSKTRKMSSSKLGMSSSKVDASRLSNNVNRGKQNKNIQKGSKKDIQKGKPPVDRKTKQKMQIASTQSLTQEINISNQNEIMNASDILMVENTQQKKNENKSKIQQSIVNINI